MTRGAQRIGLCIDTCFIDGKELPRFGGAGGYSVSKKQRQLGGEGLVDPDIGSIDPARCGVTADELRKTRIGRAPIVKPVREGECIQDRLKRSRSGLAQEEVRNILDRGRLRLCETKSFIRLEKERLVPSIIDAWQEDRSPQRLSKIILAKGWSGCAIVVIEPVIGIENIVAEVVENTPLESARTRPNR